MCEVNVGDNKCNCTLANVSFIGVQEKYPESRLCNPVGDNKAPKKEKEGNEKYLQYF